MRWTSYPGERFFSLVKFEVNGNPLDEYTSQSYVFYRQMRVMAHKEVGYNRCMGQEEPQRGHLKQPVWKNSGIRSSAIQHRFESVSYGGLQTPTGQKSEGVELLIPLLFWFNLDARLSVPSVTIPFGQRFIKAIICNGNQLVDLVPRGNGTWENPLATLDYSNMINNIYLYINNIFVNKEVHDIFIERIGFTLIRVHRYQTFTLNMTSHRMLLSQLKWPTETILVGFRPTKYNNASSDALRREHLDKWNVFHDVSEVERIESGWQSGRLELLQVNPLGASLPAGNFNNNANASVQLSYTTTANPTPISVFRELVKGDVLSVDVNSKTYNLKIAHVLRSDGTTSNSTLGKSTILFDSLVGDVTGTSQWSNSVAVDQTAYTNSAYGEDANETWRVYRPQPAERVHVVRQSTPLISEIKLDSHGIVLIDKFPQKILNSYIPYQYGGHNLKVPDDIGIYMINFCLYPGSYQPSGHINTSRAREFYLEYFGAPFDTNNTGEVVIEASCLNFLLISDGSAVLRYTT
jgi:hypothetical protein